MRLEHGQELFIPFETYAIQAVDVRQYEVPIEEESVNKFSFNRHSLY